MTTLAKASVPLMYWDEAYKTSVIVIKRLPTSVLNNKTPLEVLFYVKPDFSQLRVFGSTFNRHKLQFRSVDCTFLGCSLNYKEYKCLAPNGRISISQGM